MKKQFLLIFLVLATSLSFGQELPKPTGFVNDFAGLLTAESAKSLNNDLIAFEQKTTNEIVVVTVKSLGGRDIADYAREIGTTWGVGKKGKDNGIVFLIAPNERKMRIQTATGVRSILTDGKADEIRDGVVIPCFKSHDIPKGIIDGTHAIIDAFNPAPVPVAASVPVETSAPAPVSTPVSQSDSSQSGDRGWSEGILSLEILLSVAFVGFLICYFIILPIRRQVAKSEALDIKKSLARQIAKANSNAKNPAVENKQRRGLASVEKAFAPLQELTANSQGINWITTNETLLSLSYRLSGILEEMDQRIELAKQAKKEGPRLMKELPEKIAAAEKKLAEGKPSKEAERLLKEARSRYQAAQQQQSGMSVIDWIILYEILHASDSHVQEAESAHTYANTDHEYYSDSSGGGSSGGGASLGFGDSGGLGGGGGFDSGGGGGGGFSDSGGGSSGSW